ncbi:hypothetical protein V6N13_042848 [Hibiscus sabdariffa]
MVSFRPRFPYGFTNDRQYLLSVHCLSLLAVLGLGHFWSFLRLVHPLIWMHFVPPLGSKDRLPLALVRRRHACAYVHLKRAFVAAAVTTGEAPMRVGNSPLARDRGCVRL